MKHATSQKRSRARSARTAKLVASLALGLAACDPGPVPTDQNAQEITNGTEVHESAYRSIVRLTITAPDGRQYLCTGTFIAWDLLLTAGHCAALSNDIIIATGPKAGTPASRVWVHPRYDNNNWRGTNRFDLALLTFPVGTTPEVMPISDRSPRDGEVARIVGYGNNDNASGTGAGVKRLGLTVVDRIRDGKIHASGLDLTPNVPIGDAESVLGGGDSGGPMMNFDGGPYREIFGVASGGNNTSSFWVDLQSDSSREFLNFLGVDY